MDARTVLIDHLPALPEVLLLVGACALMIVDLYVKSERRNASFGLAQIILLLCALASLYVFLVQGQADYSRLLLFNGLFVSDTLSNLLKLVSYLSVWATLVYSRQYLVDRGLLRGEFLTLLLFSLLGMMVMISANSFWRLPSPNSFACLSEFEVSPPALAKAIASAPELCACSSSAEKSLVPIGWRAEPRTLPPCLTISSANCFSRSWPNA